MALLEDNRYDYGLNKMVLNYYSVNSKMGELTSFARRLFEEALSVGDTSISALSASVLAFQYLEANNQDSARFFADFANANAGDDDNVYRIIHNVEAIYALRFKMDYPKAMYHFQEALKYARQYGYSISEVILLSNMAYIYYYRNDTSGIKYSQEAYRIASGLSSPYASCMSSMAMSVMEYISGDYSSALKFCDQALELIGANPGFSVFLPDVLITRANSYYRQGDFKMAEEDFMKASSALDENTENSLKVKFLLSYADFLYAQGRYSESVEYYNRGIALSETSQTVDYRHRLLQGLSNAYAKLGQKDSAYMYGLRFIAVSDSLFSVSKENEMNQLFLDYQNLVHKSEMQQKELELLKSRRLTGYSLLVAAAVAVICAITYVNKRKKDEMYTLLVKRYQEYIVKNDGYKAVDDDRSRPDAELFDRLESLMNDKKLYLDKDLSMDKLCDILSTNKTYLSSAINKYAKMTLPNYINSYRIREAISIISNPDKDVLLKSVYCDVGYNSKTSFYRAFQKETGCSPLVYREKVIQLMETDGNN